MQHDVNGLLAADSAELTQHVRPRRDLAEIAPRSRARSRAETLPRAPPPTHVDRVAQIVSMVEEPSVLSRLRGEAGAYGERGSHDADAQMLQAVLDYEEFAE